ncbi:hypothetical protein J4205_03145, partial [Candidatus Pacearchaeota archaeon]|nr:hypothetical protein [Candidatus Pacearchaeota archaeon]
IIVRFAVFNSRYPATKNDITSIIFSAKAALNQILFNFVSQKAAIYNKKVTIHTKINDTKNIKSLGLEKFNDPLVSKEKYMTIISITVIVFSI